LIFAAKNQSEISIPSGAIKRIPDEEIVDVVFAFQFLLVRLKDVDIGKKLS